MQEERNVSQQNFYLKTFGGNLNHSRSRNAHGQSCSRDDIGPGPSTGAGLRARQHTVLVARERLQSHAAVEKAENRSWLEGSDLHARVTPVEELPLHAEAKEVAVGLCRCPERHQNASGGFREKNWRWNLLGNWKRKISFEEVRDE